MSSSTMGCTSALRHGASASSCSMVTRPTTLASTRCASCVMGCCPVRANVGFAKRWSAVATVAKTKELKKRYGAEAGRIITSVYERAVSRERLFLCSACCATCRNEFYDVTDE